MLDDKLLLKEWDYEKNAKKPQDYTYGSGEKVYWVCSKCGYKWRAIISSRHKGAGCPACAGNILVKGKNDLVTLKPELAKEWDYKKNNLNPNQVSYSSSHKHWWICTYIKTFKSRKAAAETCGLSTSAISNAIRKGTTSGGYRWRHHN